jgi:hypothetical protein
MLPSQLEGAINVMRDFLFPRRLARLNYILRAVPLNFLLLCATAYLEDLKDWRATDFLLVGGTLLLILYWTVYVCLARIRDCGMPTWTLLFAFIPYVSAVFGLLLLLRPSRVFEPSRTSAPMAPGEDMTRLPSVAGLACSSCGKALIFASDGIVTESNQVTCNACAQKSQALGG